MEKDKSETAEIKFRVIWHEENFSGVPKHVMGTTEPFDSRETATEWIMSTIGEDSVKAMADRSSIKIAAGEDDVFMTETPDQRCWYAISGEKA